MKKSVAASLVLAAVAAAMTISAQAETKIQFMHQQVEQERQEVVQAIIDKFQEENDGECQHNQPHQRCLSEIVPERMEELLRQISVLLLLDLEETVVERGQGRADRENGNTAQDKEQIQNQNIRHAG